MKKASSDGVAGAAFAGDQAHGLDVFSEALAEGMGGDGQVAQPIGFAQAVMIS
jgi:hypothetical protein